MAVHFYTFIQAWLGPMPARLPWTKQSRRCFYWTAFQTAKNATFAASPRPLDEMAIAAAHYWAVGSRSISDHNQDNGGCEQWTHCPHSCL